MKDHLISAYERYKQGSDSFINPISKVDAQIIEQIIEIFEKLGVVSVHEILDNYKLESDKDTLALLRDVKRQLKPNHMRSDGKAPEELISPRFLAVNGKRIDLRLIFGYEILDFYVEGNLMYGLLLNPTPENAKQIPLYSNTLLEFYVLEERDSYLIMLDNYFISTRGTFINDIEINGDEDES